MKWRKLVICWKICLCSSGVCLYFEVKNSVHKNDKDHIFTRFWFIFFFFLWQRTCLPYNSMMILLFLDKPFKSFHTKLPSLPREEISEINNNCCPSLWGFCKTEKVHVHHHLTLSTFGKIPSLKKSLTFLSIISTPTLRYIWDYGVWFGWLVFAFFYFRHIKYG